MSKLVLKLFFLSLVIMLPSLHAQNCTTGCTISISGVSNDTYILNAGDQLCISATGQFLGSVTLNGGNICNSGILQPSFLQINNGVIYNYGSLLYGGSITLLNTSRIENSGSIEIGGCLLIDALARYIGVNVQSYVITNSPAIVPFTGLQLQYCDMVSNTLNATVFTETVANAVSYMYEVTDLSTNAVYTYQSNSSSNEFQLAFLNQTITYGNTYSIRVKAKVGNAWGIYGASCNVSTPILPIKLKAVYCNTTQPYNAYISADISASPAVAFCRYEFSALADFSDFNAENADFSQILAKDDSLNLSSLAGLEAGKLYYVRVTAFDADFSHWSQPGTVCTISIPSFNLTLNVPREISACSGVSNTLSASGANAYVWTDNLGSILSSNSEITVTPTQTTMYYVSGKTGIVEKLDSVKVIVGTQPEITLNGGLEYSVCEGNSITINALGQGTFTWQNGDNVISTSASLNYKPSQSGYLQVSLKNANNCISTKEVFVKMETLKLDIPSPTIEITVGSSKQIMLNSDAQEYNWAPALYLNSASQKNPVCSPLTNQVYTVTATKNGCVKTAQINVTASLLTNYNFKYTYPGLAVQFSNVQAKQSGAVYMWDFGDGTTSNANNPLHTYAKEGVYKVKLTYALGRSQLGFYSSEVIVAASE